MIRAVEQTHKEKVEMYSKMTKLELINMLIECNTQLSCISNSYSYLVDYKYSVRGLYYHDNKIVHFSSKEDITIDSIKKMVYGKKKNNCVITKITAL